MHREQLPIPTPCQADWAAMAGDARRRFCQTCSQHVHDLSAMSEDQAAEMLAREPDPCIRYEADDAGEIVFLSRRRMLGTAAALLVSTPAAAAALPADSSTLGRLLNRLQTWLLGQSDADADPAREPTDPEPAVDTAEPPRRLMGKPVRRETASAPPTHEQAGEQHE